MSSGQYANCMEVSPHCPIQASTYGYAPNLEGNALFCALFGTLALLQLIFGIRFKTWTWMFALVIGCAMECAGYAGRLIMHSNVWNQNGFQLQIITLILAPSFMSASIDLTLKHLVIIFGEHLSHIRPALYTWLFIGLDVFSICLQAIGGGLAASGGHHNSNLLNQGNNLMLGGICVQVFQLLVFGLVSIQYFHRVLKNCTRSNLPQRAQSFLDSVSFRGFCISVLISFVSILVRCIYRIPEMAKGWGNGLQRDESTFLVLDGAMVASAALVLTIFHPGFCFDQLANSRRQVKESRKSEVSM